MAAFSVLITPSPLLPAGAYEPLTAALRAEGVESSIAPSALASTIAALDRDRPRLALTYFDLRLTVPDGWPSAPNANLAFGDTYSRELSFAIAASWPHARIQGAHLHFLLDPRPSPGE